MVLVKILMLISKHTITIITRNFSSTNRTLFANSFSSIMMSLSWSPLKLKNEMKISLDDFPDFEVENSSWFDRSQSVKNKKIFESTFCEFNKWQERFRHVSYRMQFSIIDSHGNLKFEISTSSIFFYPIANDCKDVVKCCCESSQTIQFAMQWNIEISILFSISHLKWEIQISQIFQELKWLLN